MTSAALSQKKRVKGEMEGPSKQVMNQTEAHVVFSEFCEQIEKEFKKRGRCKKLQLDKTLPPYEALQNASATTSEQEYQVYQEEWVW